MPYFQSLGGGWAISMLQAKLKNSLALSEKQLLWHSEFQNGPYLETAQLPCLV